MNIQTTIAASLTLSVFVLSPAEASTWTAVSMGFTPDRAAASYKYSAAPFVDGQSLPYDPARGPTSFVLSDNPNISAAPTTEGESRNTVTFTGFSGNGFDAIKPPMVDTVSKTIDVSSIFFESVVAAYDCDIDPNSCDPRFPKLVWRGMIGGLFGPTTPVPYTQNPDGTFTATWNATTDPLWFFPVLGTSPIYFTFAAQVPEPAPGAMFAAGVAVLFGSRRRRFLNGESSSQSNP